MVHAVQGKVTFSTDDTEWRPVAPDQLLGLGASIKTEADATADLILQYNGTALRLKPNSVLTLEKLDKQIAGAEVITETSLKLKSGALVGAQRKLAAPSRFDIAIPGGTATIRGTIYIVDAAGAVSCVSGSASVSFKGSEAAVPAGFSFNPATGQVAPITPELLADSRADVNAVRTSVQAVKMESALVVSQSAQSVSPVRGDNGVGNGQDPAPPGNPPLNDGPGTGPGNPGRGRGH